MKQAATELQRWLRKNVMSSILVAFLMLFIAMSINTRIGFADFRGDVKTARAEMVGELKTFYLETDKKLEKYQEITSINFDRMSQEQVRIAKEILGAKQDMNKKFELLIKLVQNK